MHCSNGLASGGCVFQGVVVVTDRRLFCHGRDRKSVV